MNIAILLYNVIFFSFSDCWQKLINSISMNLTILVLNCVNICSNVYLFRTCKEDMLKILHVFYLKPASNTLANICTSEHWACRLAAPRLPPAAASPPPQRATALRAAPWPPRPPPAIFFQASNQPTLSSIQFAKFLKCSKYFSEIYAKYLRDFRHPGVPPECCISRRRFQ